MIFKVIFIYLAMIGAKLLAGWGGGVEVTTHLNEEGMARGHTVQGQISIRMFTRILFFLSLLTIYYKIKTKLYLFCCQGLYPIGSFYLQIRLGNSI